MRIMKPQIGDKLANVENLLRYTAKVRENDMRVSLLSVQNDFEEKANFNHLDICHSTIENCVFKNCSFEKSSFEDVVFKNCDFSNSDFTNSYFDRCEFINCKCIGINGSNVLLKHVTVWESNFQYALFDHSKLNYFQSSNSDFSSAVMSDSTLKPFEAANSHFIGTNFFKTMLKGIDFSGSELDDFIVSDTMAELKGCTMNCFQAVDIAKMMGIIVK